MPGGAGGPPPRRRWRQEPAEPSRAAQARGLSAAVAWLFGLWCCLGASLDPGLAERLANARYVYISSMRRDGQFGRPAEIWFFVHQGDVCVGTPPDSWRVRRLRAGRPRARIAVGAPNGPSFFARGRIVEDPGAKAALLEAFARKYPEAWPRWAEEFRSGFREGRRVMVCYTPE